MEKFRYDGVTCQVCNKSLQETDDIVVCPICGTPYHRECYKKTGECLFKDKHKDGFEFELPKDIEAVKCSVCQNEVSKSAKFCENCGSPLDSNQNQTDFKQSNQQFQQPFNNNINIMFDPLGGVPQKENFDGATTSEIADYVQLNVPYYMRVFKQIKDKKTSRFNFTAFLFSGGWFLFRKQYKIGAVITIIMFLLLIASIFVQYAYALPIITQIADSAGMDFNSAVYSMDNIQKLMEPIAQMQSIDKLIVSAPTLIFFIELIIMIFCGIKANAVYMKNCVSFIKGLKEKKVDETGKKEVLRAKGGVNKGIAVSLLASYILIKNFLPYIFLR